MQPERSKLTIGISSRALFNLNNSHEIFVNEELMPIKIIKLRMKIRYLNLVMALA